MGQGEAYVPTASKNSSFMMPIPSMRLGVHMEGDTRERLGREGWGLRCRKHSSISDSDVIFVFLVKGKYV